MSEKYVAAPKSADLFQDLHTKFGQNIALCAFDSPESVAVEVKARATYHLGQILAANFASEQFRKLLANVLGEIFADTVVSVYLAGCALDNPARILGRRALPWSRPGLPGIAENQPRVGWIVHSHGRLLLLLSGA